MTALGTVWHRATVCQHREAPSNEASSNEAPRNNAPSNEYPTGKLPVPPSEHTHEQHGAMGGRGACPASAAPLPSQQGQNKASFGILPAQQQRGVAPKHLLPFFSPGSSSEHPRCSDKRCRQVSAGQGLAACTHGMRRWRKRWAHK